MPWRVEETPLARFLLDGRGRAGEQPPERQVHRHRPLLTVARWKTRPLATHTTTRPDASAKAGGGLAHTHRPMRRLLNTTPCCARAASCIPCLLRCNALLQQQITIAATLLSITPHNTPASRASAFAEQTPALSPTNRHAALSGCSRPQCSAFALLNADHVPQHFVKLAAQRHPRVDHPPRHDFRARFRARVHHDHLTPRALCPLQPVRQQTIHNIHDLLLMVHNVSHRTRHLPACCAATRSSTSSSSAQLRERLHARVMPALLISTPTTRATPADHPPRAQATSP